MTLNKYLLEPIEKRQEIVKNADWRKCPFWMERLQTAVNNSNPSAVLFDKNLVAEYWKLISK